MTVEELESIKPVDFLSRMRKMRKGAVAIGLVPDVELSDKEMVIEALMSAAASRATGRPWDDFQEAMQNKCLESLAWVMEQSNDH